MLSSRSIYMEVAIEVGGFKPNWRHSLSSQKQKYQAWPQPRLEKPLPQMKDDCLTAALRFIGKRPSWTPATDYHGDRPNLNWAAFLCRLYPYGTFAPPALRRPPFGLPRYK
jgi:hypothetical protein